ncbi:divalent metal cation transporter [Providencia sp. PROV188]|uniref:NRAMP family divalent metal transporter n=1 Tax=Providencia TaxID=586 RepID=UPI0003E1C2A2|nr:MULTISPECIES: NRAMP family divalent metal transporter [Providencia]ETS99926.1 natural resistance-associated macrophage protein [Providencia alcalifaciens PAL-3]EUD00897.1 natural resistance-associated macrophage protein [Providencia alcalifaciens PAL-1]MBG5882537.1 divalent metal cation transporter [Providencia alcalifaciens]MBS0923944.1 divalent metal cation transporter [Providencia sp. JGM181]MBS0932988.1 divalent metal cation transporter [Providencia sp. JGM172]
MAAHENISTAEYVKKRRSSLIGAIFLMATSAIGPGFITQTATFTVTLGAAFAFGILASIVIDFVVQQNIWRVVTLTKMHSSDIANATIPGSGYLLAVLVIFGGLIFNIGNIAGAGLGLNALVGLDPKWGGLLSALLAIYIFSSRKASSFIDRLIIALGLVMIGLTLFVMIASNPPIGEALRQSVLPDTVDFAMITTIVGGTVGGYICYAGAHRLLDKGEVGVENIKAVSSAATKGIIVVGVMRYVLFLAILGVVASGVTIDISGKAANPASQAFQAAAGNFGLRIFGLILWAAALTSVIGAAYTSMSFLKAFKSSITERQRNIATILFIAVSLAVYLFMGTAPAALLVFAGGFNGLILPIGLTLFVYIGWKRADLMEGYHYPRWLLWSGVVTCALTWYMGAMSVSAIFNYLK